MDGILMNTKREPGNDTYNPKCTSKLKIWKVSLISLHISLLELKKLRMLTQNFLRLTYSAIMMFLPYRQLTRLLTTLHLSDFEVGNRNMTYHAAAAACDTFYDYIFANVSKHFC